MMRLWSSLSCGDVASAETHCKVQGKEKNVKVLHPSLQMVQVYTHGLLGKFDRIRIHRARRGLPPSSFFSFNAFFSQPSSPPPPPQPKSLWLITPFFKCKAAAESEMISPRPPQGGRRGERRERKTVQEKRSEKRRERLNGRKR